MSIGHWLFLLVIAALTALLLCFSLAARPQTRMYRAARGVFWAFLCVTVLNAFHLLGVNVFSLAVSAVLGLPGCAALLVIAGM